MRVGYARTSTTSQEASIEHQQEVLREQGCEKIFVEQLSAVATNRPELDRAIDYCREGDTLVVHKLSRLARSVGDAIRIKERLEAKGASLHVLEIGDTSTPSGKLMFNVIAAVAQFERELLLERQAIGIAKAKAAGKFKGRKPTARSQGERILALKAAGNSADKIAKELQISRRSVFNVLAQHRTSAEAR